MAKSTPSSLMARCFLYAMLATAGLASAATPDAFLTKRFSSVTVTSNVPYAKVVQTTYKTGATTTVTLGLDIYQPAGDATLGRPVIIWVHGGGFRQDSTKTQAYIVNYANEFAKRGYVSISIEYRRRFKSGDGHADADVAGTPEYPALQDATRDARYALEWVRANAATYRIDPNLIFIAGGSAGGRITQTVSQFPGPDAAALYEPDLAKFNSWNRAGVIANATLWGAPEVPMRGWLYPYLTSANVAGIVPTLIVHGTADTTIAPQNATDLYNAIRLAGGTVELHMISGAGHTPTSYDSSIIQWIANFFVAQWKAALAATTPTNTPPSIVTNPQSLTVTAGSNATFTVTAAGTAPLSYQWRRNGSPLPGMTEATLYVANVSSADAGTYDVEVRNAYGVVTSGPATLTVNAAATTGTIVIWQVYPGGGKSGATYKQDFVVLRNIGAAAASLTGWSLQHLKSGAWQTPLNLPSVSVPAGAYYLIALYNDGTSNGATLPTADLTAPQNSAWNLSTSTAAAVALVTSTARLSGCPVTGVADLVGYLATSGGCYEGSGPAPTGSATQAAQRVQLQDTNNNSADFTLGTPAPRNSSSSP